MRFSCAVRTGRASNRGPVSPGAMGEQIVAKNEPINVMAHAIVMASLALVEFLFLDKIGYVGGCVFSSLSSRSCTYWKFLSSTWSDFFLEMSC